MGIKKQKKQSSSGDDMSRPKHYYISGPYTSRDWSKVAGFVSSALAAGERVARLGYLVHVPHVALPSGISWDEAMRRCLEDLSYCDGVILVSGWERSRGAQMERDVALGLGLPVWTLDEFLALHDPRMAAQCPV
jgi:hypothetical protein